MKSDILKPGHYRVVLEGSYQVVDGEGITEEELVDYVRTHADIVEVEEE